MHNPRTLKGKFLNKWMSGLRVCTSISERRRIIRLSAELALASVRNGSTRWSRAVIRDAFQRHDDKGLVEIIMVLDGYNPTGLVRRETKRAVIRSKKMSRRQSRRGPRNESSLIAKRVVKKRTQFLKELVPVGLDVDAVSLIEETLDYILVEVMRSLASCLPHSRTGDLS